MKKSELFTKKEEKFMDFGVSFLQWLDERNRVRAYSAEMEAVGIYCKSLRTAIRNGPYPLCKIELGYAPFAIDRRGMELVHKFYDKKGYVQEPGEVAALLEKILTKEVKTKILDSKLVKKFKKQKGGKR